MTNTYHATPYDISATGFYFSTLEEYRSRAACHRNEYGEPVEEYEIQFIDGDNAALFEAIGVNQANLADWFERFEDLDVHDAYRLVALIEHFGYRPDEALDRLDELHLTEGSAADYAERYLDDSGLMDQVPDSLRPYIDTDAFARDLLLNGDIIELEIDGTDYIAERL